MRAASENNTVTDFITNSNASNIDELGKSRPDVEDDTVETGRAHPLNAWVHRPKSATKWDVDSLSIIYVSCHDRKLWSSYVSFEWCSGLYNWEGYGQGNANIRISVSGYLTPLGVSVLGQPKPPDDRTRHRVGKCLVRPDSRLITPLAGYAGSPLVGDFNDVVERPHW